MTLPFPIPRRLSRSSLAVWDASTGQKQYTFAVTTSDNGIKILENADGQRVLRMLEVSRSVSKQSNSNVKAVVDSTRAADVKPRIPEETKRIRSWKLTEIVNVGHLKTLCLPDSTSACINSGSGRAMNEIHRARSERNSSPSASDNNERSDNNPEEATTCIALSKNDSYATSKQLLSSSLLMYILTPLLGDYMQLYVWSIGSWEKKDSLFIQAFTGCTSPLVGDIQIQFHSNQTHLLVVHERQIAIYNSKLDSLCWVSSLC
ncbi:hypothetical protein ZIOFF_028489 [Zingiber officinale]|uniref:Uncharacterized protein n=1 Tax=Zingiber officinale TaxID=94328 RepID=A0A8J5H6C5_ZINOF|nr:hypothetical protein ZIOFF_028489 [Zingiber officinale]